MRVIFLEEFTGGCTKKIAFGNHLIRKQIIKTKPGDI